MAGTEKWKLIDKFLGIADARPTAIQHLAELILARPNLNAVAVDLGISITTLRRRLNKYPQVLEIVESAPASRERWVTLPNGNRVRLHVALREQGLSREIFYKRTRRAGMSESDALSSPPRRRRGKIELAGRALWPHEWAKEKTIPLTTICSRRDRGWSPEEILSGVRRKDAGT